MNGLLLVIGIQKKVKATNFNFFLFSDRRRHNLNNKATDRLRPNHSGHFPAIPSSQMTGLMTGPDSGKLMKISLSDQVHLLTGNMMYFIIKRQSIFLPLLR